MTPLGVKRYDPLKEIDYWKPGGRSIRIIAEERMRGFWFNMYVSGDTGWAYVPNYHDAKHVIEYLRHVLNGIPDKN